MWGTARHSRPLRDVLVGVQDVALRAGERGQLPADAADVAAHSRVAVVAGDEQLLGVDSDQHVPVSL